MEERRMFCRKEERVMWMDEGVMFRKLMLRLSDE